MRKLKNFFFSSRRRHTIYWRDWSSDVCSSDLGTGADRGEFRRDSRRRHWSPQLARVPGHADRGLEARRRSEERRVGKASLTRLRDYLAELYAQVEKLRRSGVSAADVRIRINMK